MTWRQRHFLSPWTRCPGAGRWAVASGASSFALALVRPPAADVGVRVLVGGVAGELVDLPFATRGRVGAADSEGEDDDAAAKAAAAKAAEAERKAAKLKAMQEKMKALGLA